ncbi:MAG: hypothetical protein FJX92_01165 [Bacteroidetes bacterium]|nr:hypothetical protein [Bacteroidota bacterium]
MPDFIQLLKKRIRFLAISLLLAWSITCIVLWFLPIKYKGETTSVPSSAYASDPNRLFSKQIQQLYSPLGSPDELDLLVGSGRLDTVYRPLVRQFNLVKHYFISDLGEKGIWRAVKQLKKDAKVYKSEYNELKVHVWDTDPVLAADLANALTARLDSLHRDLMGRQNQQTRDALQKGLSRLRGSDSLPFAQKLQQEIQYLGFIDQYTLLLEQRPSSIQVLDPAVVPVFSDKPLWGLTLIAVTILTMLVWLVASLWMARRTVYELSPDK